MNIFSEENQILEERRALCRERLQGMVNEKSVPTPYLEYFTKLSKFILRLYEISDQVQEGYYNSCPLQELQAVNRELYEDILPKNYDRCFGNPEYAVAQFGENTGHYLTFLYAEIRASIPRVFEQRHFDLTVVSELFIEIYNIAESYCADIEKYPDLQESMENEIREAIYYYAHDYSEIFMELKTKEMLDPSYSFAADLIEKVDLSDIRYLYLFGEYITENEIRIANFLNQMTEEEVRAMSFTYTDGYRRGFQVMGADFDKKSIVSIRYFIGFERMMKMAMEYFSSYDKKVTVFRNPVDVINSTPGRKTGFHTTSPNPQYEYDHRFDQAIFLDNRFKEHKLDCYKNAMEKFKEEAAQFAGPAVLETFGEPDFQPKAKPQAAKLSSEQEKILNEYKRDAGILSMNYIKQEETSFTIIAYPLPSIGDEFEAIFAETVKINTLDNDMYYEIQQSLIDALDLGNAVHIKGNDRNQTDLIVMLHELTNPAKETIFENCTADVNIPVGEVFTSPKLTGTNGILHVSSVYLNGLEFKNLSVEFKDGRIASYTCGNFDNEKDNKAFVKENVLMNQETLALGEFAIGTNTRAYVMGRKFNIQAKLPILIAEKTGPHFAVGDTCYHMSEDHKVYNRDGKEIVARDNEVSILRKTEIEKAYYNCHTDITIPYDEIGAITILHKDGTSVDIIKDGLFVLKGTERLNDALHEDVK